MSNLPKKMEKFNNFVSHSFKVTDDSVSTIMCMFLLERHQQVSPASLEKWFSCELHVSFISPQEKKQLWEFVQKNNLRNQYARREFLLFHSIIEITCCILSLVWKFCYSACLAFLLNTNMNSDNSLLMCEWIDPNVCGCPILSCTWIACYRLILCPYVVNCCSL